MRWVPFVLCVVACEADVSFSGQEGSQTWLQAPNDQIDILWVIDNSSSMGEEQERLAQGFSSFADQLINSEIRFHLGVITTEFDYLDPERGRLVGDPAVLTHEDADFVRMFEERANVGTRGPGQEKGLEAAAYALSPEMETSLNRGFLRPEADLLVVFVSDEDDCSHDGNLGIDNNAGALCRNTDLLTPVEDFVERFGALKPDPGRVRIGAIVGPESAADLAGCDDQTTTGDRYLSLTAYAEGSAASVCEADWSATMQDLGLQATGIQETFFLDERVDPESLRVFVNDNEVGMADFDAIEANGGGSGWTYNPSGPSITFHGDAIPPRGAIIEVEYIVQPG